MIEENGKNDDLPLRENGRAALVLAVISLMLLLVLFAGLRQNLVGVHDELVRLEQKRIVILEEKVARLELLLSEQSWRKLKSSKP